MQTRCYDERGLDLGARRRSRSRDALRDVAGEGVAFRLSIVNVFAIVFWCIGAGGLGGRVVASK